MRLSADPSPPRGAWLRHVDVAVVAAAFAIGAAAADWGAELVWAGYVEDDASDARVAALSDLVFTLFHAVPVIGSVALIAFVLRRLPLAAMRAGRPTLPVLELGLIGGLAAYGVMVFFDALSGDVGGVLPGYVEEVGRDGFALAIEWLDTVVLFPLLEELFFRGVVFEWAWRAISLPAAFVVSAGLFAAYHMDWHHAPSLIAMGLIMGWVYWRTGSLWTAVLAHAAYNAAVSLSVHLWA